MTFLTFLYRQGLWTGPLLFVLALFTLISAIRFLIRTGRSSGIASLPLVAEQKVELSGVDRVVLSAEGPLLSYRFAHLKFTLVGPDGRRIGGHPTLFHTHSSGLRRGRMELRSFPVPHSGTYDLIVEGLGEPQPRDAECRILLSRPHGLQNIGGTLGIVFSALILVGSLVLFLLRLLVKDGSATG